MIDYSNELSYLEKKNLYTKEFSFGVNLKIDQKMGLISMLCYLTHEFKKKVPDITHYKVLMKIDSTLDNNTASAIAITCEDWSQGTTEFPTFGVQPKDMPKKIKDILLDMLPF